MVMSWFGYNMAWNKFTWVRISWHPSYVRLILCLALFLSYWPYICLVKGTFANKLVLHEFVPYAYISSVMWLSSFPGFLVDITAGVITVSCIYLLCHEVLLLFVQGILSIPCKSLFNPTHVCKGPLVVTFRVSSPTVNLLLCCSFKSSIKLIIVISSSSLISLAFVSVAFVLIFNCVYFALIVFIFILCYGIFIVLFI